MDIAKRLTMTNKESFLIAQSNQRGTLFKEGDVVRAIVDMGAKVPAGKTGVVTDMYGTPPHVGYEVDFLPLGHTVTVMPHQIELKKPAEPKVTSQVMETSRPLKGREVSNS